MSITVTSANVRPGNGYDVETRSFKTGAACTVGYCVYLDSSGYIQHADANTDAVAPARGMGLIVESPDGETAIASGRWASVVIHGPVEGFSGMTPGAPVYVDTTPGRVTHTKPTGGAYQRSIGYALSETGIMVDPDVEDPSSV